MKTEDKPKMKVTFLGSGGGEQERERASKFFIEGGEYFVIGGRMDRYHTSYEIEGIEGVWNSCLFSGDPFDAPVEFPYGSYLHERPHLPSRLLLAGHPPDGD